MEVPVPHLTEEPAPSSERPVEPIARPKELPQIPVECFPSYIQVVRATPKEYLLCHQISLKMLNYEMQNVSLYGNAQEAL